MSSHPHIMKLVLLLLLMPCSSLAQGYTKIVNYKVNYSIATSEEGTFIGLRSFEDEHRQQILFLVNPRTLATRLDYATNYKIVPSSLQSILREFSTTDYVRDLSEASLNDVQLQDAGIRHIKSSKNGINLTIDLCPSTKPLDRDIFQSIFAEFQKSEAPFPVAISISGRWILKHQDDLEWLKNLVMQHKLDITWINHTYNHEVNKLPLKENFLLSKGTNLDIEVLENEKLMIKNGLVPSVFFRFPGLVSDASLVDKIEEYGLIPIGSDAWLAKGQIPKTGSIVLIHGNGNEELGVRDFIKLLKQEKIKGENHSWLLLDLRNSLEQQY